MKSLLLTATLVAIALFVTPEYADAQAQPVPELPMEVPVIPPAPIPPPEPVPELPVELPVIPPAPIPPPEPVPELPVEVPVIPPVAIPPAPEPPFVPPVLPPVIGPPLPPVTSHQHMCCCCCQPPPVSGVPEPATIMSGLFGLTSLAGYRVARRKKGIRDSEHV